MLTVKELIAELSLLDPDAVVIMQRDGEGNGYSPCSGAEGNGAWDRKEREYGYATLTPALEESGYSEEDVIAGVPAVVIYPAY
jgi:hypothetical protein